jgi:hypothetical protein
MKPYRILISFCLLFLSASAIAQVTEPADSIIVDARVFEKLEVEASFPGGYQGWKQYLEKNLDAATPVDNGAPAGKYTVLVKFIVNRDGIVTDVKALTNQGYGMELEVIRLIKSSGKWNPGSQNGRFVNSYHTQPVTFVVTFEGLDILSKVQYVLFTGIDNELTIEADKIKTENLKVTISKGKITPTADGKFIARVTDTTQRAVITVYNAKKNDKEIGAVSFEVKPQRKTPDAVKE